MADQEPVDIPAHDLIARFVAFPTKMFGEAIDRTMLFQFEQLEESGVWRGRAPRDEDVHERGCRKSRIKNARKQAEFAEKQAQGKKPSELKREFYCGFLEAERGALEVETDYAKVVVEQITEDGDDAHVAIRLVYRSDPVDKVLRTAWRSEIRNELSNRMANPRTHRCPEDEDIPHPLDRFPNALEDLAA